VLQYDSDSDNKISSREEDHDDGEEFGGLIPEDDPDSCGEPGEEDKEDIGDENPARSICASTNFCSWLQCFSSNLFSFDDVDVAAGIPLQSNSDIQQGLALQEWHRCVCCFLCEDRILFEIRLRCSETKTHLRSGMPFQLTFIRGATRAAARHHRYQARSEDVGRVISCLAVMKMLLMAMSVAEVSVVLCLSRGQESTCSVVDGEETFRTRQGLDLSVVDQKVVGEDAAAMFAIKSGL
ncbi:hypothetical protein PC116_g23160, partial [Phytophthora cactorum]